MKLSSNTGTGSEIRKPIKEKIQRRIEYTCRCLFSTNARGALAPAIFGHFSTVGKNCGCKIKILLRISTHNIHYAPKIQSSEGQ